MSTLEPIPLRVVRWRCPHCQRTRASKSRVRAHMAECWKNPDARSCLTCAHWDEGSDGCFNDPYCDCASPPECCLGLKPIDEGVPYVLHCPKWRREEV